MGWLREWVQSRTAREELSEEMEQHLQEKQDALEQAGMSRAEAYRAARRSFGNKALLQDRSYEVWQGRYLSPLLADFKFGWGQLKRAPIFALIATVVLAVGIGANTSAFTLFYAVNLRDLPVHDPSALVFVRIMSPKINSYGMGISYPLLEQLRSRQQSFTDISGWQLRSVTIADEQDMLRNVSASLVTGNSFDLLGLRPARGRMLTPSDDVPGDPAGGWPVVLSYGFWKQNFGGDPAIVGRTITISGASAVVVGVTPRSFEGILVGFPSRVFLPLHFLTDHRYANEVGDPLSQPSDFKITAIGRLKDGVTLSQANAEIGGYTKTLLDPVVPVATQATPYLQDARLQVTSASKGFSALEDYRSLLWVLQKIMAVVLFLCCLNVAGMQLARFSQRGHEFAIRIALGASRWHIVRQSLAEATLLVTGGAVLAAIASYCSTVLLSSFLTKPGSGENIVIDPDWAVFAIAGGIAVMTTLGVGILPALFAGRTAPNAVLKMRSVLHRGPIFGGRVLVPVQIALSLVLVMVAGLFTSTLTRLREEDKGFHIDHVVEVCAQFQYLRKTPQEIMDLYRQIVHRLRTEPGIQNVTMTWITPMTGVSPKAEVFAAGGLDGHRIAFNRVGPRYFETLQIPLLAGREFSEDDKDQSTCIVNRETERLFYAGGSALGQELDASYGGDFSDLRCRIVGVVENAKYANMRDPEGATLYFPITADALMLGGYRRNMVIFMQADKDESAMSAYRKVLAEVAPTTPYAPFLPLRTQMDQALGSERLLCLMSVLFGAITLPLCGIGIFGLLAMRVEQRTSEIAIRLALGSGRMHVLRQVLRESMSLLGLGLALGTPTLFFVAKLTRHFLYETSPLNVRDIATALLVLTAVALCAALIPGSRAARLDPIQILRRE